jgi:hypothetical protein
MFGLSKGNLKQAAIRVELFSLMQVNTKRRIQVELFSLMTALSPERLNSSSQHFLAGWQLRRSGLLRRGV